MDTPILRFFALFFCDRDHKTTSRKKDAFLRPRAAFTFSLFVPMLTVINSIKNRKYDAVRSSRPLRFDLTGTAVGQCVPVSVRGIGALNSTAARLSASTHDGHSPIAAPYGFPCGLFLCAAPRVAPFPKANALATLRMPEAEPQTAPKESLMPVAGVDVGSVAAKAVILDELSLDILGKAVLPTGWNPREAGEKALAAACADAGNAVPLHVTATGYGRVSLPFAHNVVTEISCHAVGAVHLFPETGVVLDIGGQDSKVISTGPDGIVQDFLMNDKCAAGTGRFLQVLSGILDMDLAALGEAAARGKPAAISSMCAVFAETEIIGLLARGTPPADVAAGVFLSIARRMRGLASRIPMRGQCTFTGGLALCPAFSTLLSAELGIPVNVPPFPQLTGALGAALLAARKLGHF